MKRRPRPLVVTTALPTLATLLGAGTLQGCHPERWFRTENPPEPVTPQHADAGAAPRIKPTPVDPDHLPPRPAGAIAPVAPHPASAQGELGVPERPAAAVPFGGSETPTEARILQPEVRPRVLLVHDHPPGAPCQPISHEALREAVRRLGR